MALNESMVFAVFERKTPIFRYFALNYVTFSNMILGIFMIFSNIILGIFVAFSNIWLFETLALSLFVKISQKKKLFSQKHLKLFFFCLHLT